MIIRSVVLALVALTPLTAQTDPTGIDAACRALAADGPGLAVLVANNGQVVHRAAYGFADAAAEVPLRVEQPFYVASVAKAFTAACIVDLALAGRLNLDDEVRKHVPDLPDHCRGITLRHLLHHRSGLRDFYELEVLAGRKTSELTPAKVKALILRQRALNFAPGTDFLYCNTGYVLLAEVVERVGGSPLGSHAREHLFQPLGMTRSVFRDDAHPIVDDAVRAGDDGDGMAPPLLVGPGGLYTNVDDLHRWLDALTGGIWRPDLVRTLVTPPALGAEQRRSPKLTPYACGLVRIPFAGESALLLRGGLGGWQAAAMSLPIAKVQVIVLANGEVDAVDAVRTLARTVLGSGESARPDNDAKPGFVAYRGADGELLFHATRRSGESFLTTLGWKVEVVEHDGEIRSFEASTELAASRRPDGGLEVRIDGETPRIYQRAAMQRTTKEDTEALAGRWHGEEIDGDITLIADGGRLRIDTSSMEMPIAPFSGLDRDTWISDTGMQIDVRRAADGTPNGLRVSTARARGLEFTRR